MLEIHTPVVNNPKFIEMQDMTNKRFINEPYKFIIFNDAKDWEDFTNYNNPSIKKEITSLCAKLNIECINIPNEHHKSVVGGTERCADSYNYILEYEKINNCTKVLSLDSDMFIINDFSSDKYKDYDMAVVPQERFNNLIKYFWNGLYFFDYDKIKNRELLNWSVIRNKYNENITDVGGSMFNYINNTPNANIYNIHHHWSCGWNKLKCPDNINPILFDFLDNDPKNVNGNYFAELYDDVFLHYRAGGNWEKLSKDLHDMRTNLLYDTIVNIVKS